MSDHFPLTTKLINFSFTVFFSVLTTKLVTIKLISCFHCQQKWNFFLLQGLLRVSPSPYDICFSSTGRFSWNFFIFVQWYLDFWTSHFISAAILIPLCRGLQATLSLTSTSEKVNDGTVYIDNENNKQKIQVIQVVQAMKVIKVIQVSLAHLWVDFRVIFF